MPNRRKRRGGGPPVCSSCRATECTELESPKLRDVWAWYEGVKWSWKGNLAYWELCLPCHRNTWPLDHRTQNRYSCPDGLQWRKKTRGGITRLCLGDLYVTQSMPDCCRPQSLFSGPIPSNLEQELPSSPARAPTRVRPCIPQLRQNLRFSLGRRANPCEEPLAKKFCRRTPQLRECGVNEEILNIEGVPPAERGPVFLVDIHTCEENNELHGVYMQQNDRLHSLCGPSVCDTSGCTNVLPNILSHAAWNVCIVGLPGWWHTAFLCRQCTGAVNWLNFTDVFEDTGYIVTSRKLGAEERLKALSASYTPKRPRKA